MNRTPTRIAIALALMLGLAATTAKSQQPGAKPGYTVRLLDSERAEWYLVRVDEEIYFWRIVPRPPREDDAQRAGKLQFRCVRLDVPLQSAGPIVAHQCGDWAECSLTADYSTVPPGVKSGREGAAYSNWKFHKKGRQQFTIQNVNDLGKPAWLAVSDVAYVQPSEDGKFVTEFRPAVLSFDKATVFSIVETTQGK